MGNGLIDAGFIKPRLTIRIQATDKSGSVILMDGVMGNIIVRSSNKVLINT